MLHRPPAQIRLSPGKQLTFPQNITGSIALQMQMILSILVSLDQIPPPPVQIRLSPGT